MDTLYRQGERSIERGRERENICERREESVRAVIRNAYVRELRGFQV